MAITNAQQFKQLVNPPMKGKRRPGYRGEDAYGGGTTAGGQRSGGERGDGPASRDFGGPGRDKQMGMGGKKRPMGRNPMVSYEEDPVTTAQKARELIALGNLKVGFGDKINFPDFFPTIKTGLNLIKVPQGTFMDQARKDFSRALGPQAVDMSGGGGDGPVPYWAQLGFNSEAEYLASLAAQGTSTEEQEPEEIITPSYRFMNKGGIADVVGGEYDFESARQMYGLGKLVKKVTRTVKKIAKSPIGKAALLYAGTAGLGSLASGGGMGSLFRLGTYAPSSVAANFPAIFTKAGAKNILFGGEKLLGNPAKGNLVPFSGILGTGGKMSALKAIGLPTLASYLMTPKEEDEDEEVTIDRGEKLEFPENRYRFFQEGGSTEKEPVAKKTMPLLDMGGKEKDYRETGGFVDMGRMEKADDVPARLSKNEFVFTADAVRNAGDGSVDKGAEVMYNMMKNLEAGGDVSEESQGLEGARKMFQTSQRLGEVI